MKRLFIISNRLPVHITDNGQELSVNRSAGGLVTALSSYLFDQESNGDFDEITWVGVPGCTPANWTKAKHQVAENDYNYLPVFINKKCYEAYYNGQSNSVIWPLFHYFPSFAEFGGGYFESYMEANKQFVETIQPHLHPGDTIWIHDYHLMPLAGMIREAFPDVTIGFFLHVPFPSYEIFRIMPRKWQEAMIVGMMGADLIGFHTIDYATHFLKSVQMVLGLEDNMHVLQYKNRLVKVDVFPISVDYTSFSEAYDNEEVVALRNKLKDQFRGKKMIFSADRLDYTKGVYSRLKAFELFLLDNPTYHEKVQFVLVVVPSRDTISRYAERKKMIDEYIGDINSRIGNINWQPVIYQYANLDTKELVAMYTACDLALITPLRDGMNLVAKEFVASRKDLQGVLVLSDMAGAAKELTDALMINPNDHEDMAERIKQGLEMPAEEQSRRMKTMRKRVEVYSVKTWAKDFVRQLQHIKGKQMEYEVRFLDPMSKIDLANDYLKASRRLLLLDYDGTLVPFSSEPHEAAPGQKLLDVLEKLSSDPQNDVYIISGRDGNSLQNWLGHLSINLIAEHGAKSKLIGAEWTQIEDNNAGWKPQVEEVMSRYVQRCANSTIEMKEYSLAWHYRNANIEQARLRSAELYSELMDFTKHKDLSILNGNKVIEVRKQGVDKGSAVKKILAGAQYDFILAFGDDTTDEDMFQTLAPYDQAYTIKIGNQASYAKFNLHTSFMVLSMLEMISTYSPNRISTEAVG